MLNLYLTGFMGSGKSTVGQLMADRLNMRFLDTDACVEVLAGSSIAEIFANQGEAVFRKMERSVCHKIPSSGHVVSLGGGAFINETIRAIIAEQSLSIFLEWPFEVLAARIGGDGDRPLSGDPEKMATLYASRLPIYRKADLIWVSALPHEMTAAEVAEWVLAMVVAHPRWRATKKLNLSP